MATIERLLDRTARTAARLTEKRDSFIGALRDARRSYDEKRDAVDMDHLRVMLGFWLAADSNCVDIGAHQGSVLRMIEARAPQGVHHAFEPIPRLAVRLRQSFPSVTVHEVALSDSRGTAEFTVVDGDERAGYSGISQSLRSLPPTWVTHPITVTTARLDDVLPPGYEPRFVKIDVEGAELAVLRGARGVLSRCHPIIFMEHGAGDGTGEIHALLTGLGYAIHNVDGDGPFEDADAMVAGARGTTGWLWNWVCVESGSSR